MVARWVKSLIVMIAALSVGAAAAEPRAQIQELPVPKITIYPGDVIGQDSLTTKSFRLKRDDAPIIRDAVSAVGKVARRTLIAGMPIPSLYLRDRQVVQQGKPVRITYSHGPLMIAGMAMPLQSGGIGDTLNLRNVDSGITIKGIVEADGSVRVAGP